MGRRRDKSGLRIEPTRDRVLVRAMLARGAMVTEGLEWPAACYLLAWLGDEAVGVAGVETSVDAALLRSLWVKPAMRAQGIGSALFAAARKAAHTRGARQLYLLGEAEDGYLKRLGFQRVAVAEVMVALAGTPQVEYYRARPDELMEKAAWRLDISQDGVIGR